MYVSNDKKMYSNDEEMLSNDEEMYQMMKKCIKWWRNVSNDDESLMIEFWSYF